MNAAVFHQAVADGDATRVKFLINIGQQARVNQVNKQGFTALQQSCKDGKLDVVHVLLNHGANTSLTGKKDRTALHFAASGGHKQIVELLIKSCADVSVKDGEGNTPVDVAKTEEIAELLAGAEAEKKAKSRERSNSKNNNEEWGQNFRGLPPGSRNSLVSNSSSDSGVFTEESSTSSSRTTDSRLSTSKNGNRGVLCENRPLMGVLNEGEEVHERSCLTAQTTVEPSRPKLRRSMSERLPAHRRKRSIGKLSEELSALNLARVASQEYSEADELTVNDQSYNNSRESELRVCDKDVYISPCGNVLDYHDGMQKEDTSNDGCSSVRKFLTNNEEFLAKNHHEPVVCYAEKDEGWEDDDALESSPPILAQRIRDDAPHLRPKGCDDLELYRRSQRRSMRNTRRRTLDACEVSHEKMSSYDEHANNSPLWVTAEHRRPSYEEHIRNHGVDYSVSSAQEYGTYSCATTRITRTFSACSDTEIRKYYRRLEDMSKMSDLYGRYPTEYYNTTNEYCDYQNFYPDSRSNNLPGYEESLRRIRTERARRPSISRQVSQV